MRYDLEFICFDVKIKKWFYIILLILLWGIILPFLLNKAEITILRDLDYSHYFNEFQIFISLLLVCFLFIFIRYFVDSEQLEVLRSIDHHLKLRFVVYIFVVYQIILIPIYILTVLFFPLGVAIQEIVNVMYQQAFISAMFYSFTFLVQSSFSAFGVVLGYIFIFTNIIIQPLFMNVFHIAYPLEYISLNYYVINILIMIIFVCFGIFAEKRILK